jgi:hypothetical protein
VRNATHELVAVSLAVAAGRVLNAGPVETAGLTAAALLGSRLPDVDQLGARVHRRTRLERRTLVGGAAGAVLRLPLMAFALVVPHRTVTHSALACAAAAALAALVASPAGPARQADEAARRHGFETFAAYLDTASPKGPR